jgi:transcription initiation factor IIE alpha subunit
MLDHAKLTSMRMERQHLTHKANEIEYIDLYRDLSPGYNVYWNGFGDPPTLTYRADFNDMEYNRRRQAGRSLVKARLMGGNIGWIMAEDMELFACVYAKPLDKPSERQTVLLELIEREGPLTIHQMKEATGMLVKEITPVLHRLQEAFLIYEDQNEGQDDRGWYKFVEMFPKVNLNRYSRVEALKILLRRFAFRLVWFDLNMAKSYFKLPAKEIKTALAEQADERLLLEVDGGYMLTSDVELSDGYAVDPPKSVYAMHRNDFLVKAQEHILKERYLHPYPDTLSYLLVDGEWQGAVAGKFRYTPEIEDVLLDLPPKEAAARKDEVLSAIQKICPWAEAPKRYQGRDVL